MQNRRSGPALRSGVADRRLWPVVAIAAVTVAFDQATKAWAVGTLDDGRTIDLVWTLRFRLVLNRGSAFGIVEGFAPLFALAALVIVIFLLRAGRSVRGRVALAAVGLVIGGAIGNLFDRLFREGGGLFGGAVVDFVDLQWWPVFNVADAAIVVGSVLLAFTAAREEP